MNRVVDLTDEWDQNTSRASQQQMVSVVDGHHDEQEHNQAKKNLQFLKCKEEQIWLGLPSCRQVRSD